MRTFTLLIALITVMILNNNANCQQSKPQRDRAKNEHGGPLNVKDLEPAVIQELREIERDLERVLSRMTAIEVTEKQFALERVMISKAYEQIMRKLFFDSRPKKVPLDAEDENSRIPNVIPKTAPSAGIPKRQVDAACR